MDFKDLFKKYKKWVVGGVIVVLIILENVVNTGGL